MSYQPFYITQYEDETGFENYFESFLLPEKAFPILEDAYCWRGRVIKRGGTFLLGRLNRNLVDITLTIQASGGSYVVADLLAASPINARGAFAVTQETNAEIDAGTLKITVGALTFTDNGAGVLTSSGANTGTINYITGALSLTFSPALGVATNVVVTFSYFPALPVMGLRRYTIPGDSFTFLEAFDQKYSYEYSYIDYSFFETDPGVTWTGSNSDLFWTTNYNTAGAAPTLWATNFNGAIGGDPLRYLQNGTWTDFTPTIDLTPHYMYSCLALLPFKERLVSFNTWEGLGGGAPTSVNYPVRLRWNRALSDPTVEANWVAYPNGAGGYFDMPTDDPIVSVEYLKDLIIIKCANSSWRLTYTGDQVNPFAVQKINTSFGASSTFSLVPFDDGVYSIGYRGITTDDTDAVERIDLKIPDEYLNIEFAPYRAYGIRDYFNELVYWAYTYGPLVADVPLEVNPDFNNQVLVYNYRNNSFAKFNDSYTCFGLFYIEIPDPDMVAAGINAFSSNVIAGNQQGYVEVLNIQNLNSPSLSITAITPGSPVTITVPNHNFNPGATDYWVRISGIIGNGPNNPSALNNATTSSAYHLTSYTDINKFKLEVWDDANSDFVPVGLPAGGTYLGGGTITVVQNFNIYTKVFAPFYEQGMQNRVPYIDFLTDNSALNQNPQPALADAGQYTVNVYLNECPVAINNPELSANSSILGNNVVYTIADNPLVGNQVNQEKIWHRFYSPYISQNFQLQMTMSNLQMSNYDITNNNFVLHATTLYLSPNARMTQ